MKSTLNVVGFFDKVDSSTLGLISSLNEKLKYNLRFILSFDDSSKCELLNQIQNIQIVDKNKLNEEVSLIYGCDLNKLSRISESYKPFYKILLGIYCRRILNINYCLMTDNDIYIFSEIPEIEKCIDLEQQFFIQEKNQAYEIPDLRQFIEYEFKLFPKVNQPVKGKGLNVGFCGVKLCIYDNLQTTNFDIFCNLFSNLDAWWKEQSFIILMAHTLSEDIETFEKSKYFFMNHDDYRYPFKSKIFHCINSSDKSRVADLYAGNGLKFFDLLTRTTKGISKDLFSFFKRSLAKMFFPEKLLEMGGERYKVLFNYLKSTNCKSILEIGVWKGNTAALILHSSKNKNIIYHGIDVFEGTTGELIENEVSLVADSKNTIEKKLKKISKNVSLHKGYSTDVFPSLQNQSVTFDCIWIDGGHSYETVKFDFDNYSKLLSKGGIIFIDDYTSDSHLPDVKSFVDKELLNNPKYIVEIYNDHFDTYRGYHYKVATVRLESIF